MSMEKVVTFESLKDKVGRFNLRDKTFLIPEMNRTGAHLLAGVFRGFGIKAIVLETYKGLDLGKEHTSGKECYPCQITLGDILYFMNREKERLGDAFRADKYVYFMPESNGPCRFGMYNKYQRIVLDTYPGLNSLKIGSMSTGDGYSVAGMIEKERVRPLRKSGFFSQVVGDILDRVLWRVRPYEKRPGMAAAYMEEAIKTMADAFERYGAAVDFDSILKVLEKVLKEAAGIIDPAVPPKPLIGVVGEIYLRTHVESNQHLIEVLERYGAEVVNASITEWLNYTTYDRLREEKAALRMAIKQLRFGGLRERLGRIAGYGAELLYQQRQQKMAYQRARRILDLAEDHKIASLEDILVKEKLFCFDVGTEACLSIPAIIEYAKAGYNGVVNVYPFTCMPSTMTSAVVRPIMNRLKIPYLDTPYDSSVQPGREAAIRTFMYQAQQHFKRHGRKNLQH
jgi:predicted nucleotide-binding protein (sugar kinase/HSP70/actin superfamily)